MGSRPSARSMRASSAWNRGTSCVPVVAASHVQAVIGERAGGGDVAQVEVMAGVVVLRGASRGACLPARSRRQSLRARRRCRPGRGRRSRDSASESLCPCVVFRRLSFVHGLGREPPGFGQEAQGERDVAGVPEPDRCLLGLSKRLPPVVVEPSDRPRLGQPSEPGSEQGEVVGKERPLSQRHRRAEVLGPSGRREAGEDPVAPIELPEHPPEVIVATQPVPEKIERVLLTTSKPRGLDEPFVAVEHGRFARLGVGALLQSGAEGLGHHVEDPLGWAAEQGAEALAQEGVRGPGDGRVGAVLENQPSASKTPEQRDQTGLRVQEEPRHLASGVDQHTEQIERHAAGEHGQAGEQLPLLDRQAFCVVREHARELGRFRVVARHGVEVEVLHRLDASMRRRSGGRSRGPPPTARGSPPGRPRCGAPHRPQPHPSREGRPPPPPARGRRGACRGTRGSSSPGDRRGESAT